MKNLKKTIDLKRGKILGFKVNKELLNIALTHPNYTSKVKLKEKENFEGLEFVGDSVIDLIVADWLYKTWKKEKVGMLSKIRSILVQTDSLAHIGRELELEKYMFVEPHYKITKTDLEDCLEALFGAIYLSKGIKKAYKFFLVIFKEKLDEITELMQTPEGRVTLEKSVVCEKNPINELQELCQKAKVPLPQYNLVKKEGPEHNPLYHVECKVNLGQKLYTSRGSGRNLKEAKKMAAEKILNLIEKRKW